MEQSRRRSKRIEEQRKLGEDMGGRVAAWKEEKEKVEEGEEEWAVEEQQGERKRSKKRRGGGGSRNRGGRRNAEERKGGELHERAISAMEVKERRRKRIAKRAKALLAKLAWCNESDPMLWLLHPSRVHTLHARLCTLRIELANLCDGDEDGAAGLHLLPRHVQTTIFAMLPLRKISQLRAVCRSWNSILRPQSFIENVHSQVGETEGWLVMSRTRRPFLKEFLAYSPSQQRIFPLPGPAHPCIAAHLGYRAMCVAVDDDNPWLALPKICGSGVGGLLCCLVDKLLAKPMISFPTSLQLFRYLFDGYKYSVLVFNPLTGAVHRLPPPPILAHSQGIKVSMHAHNGNHYHVALIHHAYHHVELYNSMTRSWKVAPACMEAHCGTLDSLTDGDLFFWDFRACWLYFYSLAKDVWCKIRLLTAGLERPSFGADPIFKYASVLQCGAQKLLAAPLVAHLPPSPHLHGFAVWQLHTSQGEVRSTLISTTPWKEVVSHADEIIDLHVSFTTDGKHICMTGMCNIAYDLVGDRWYMPPSYIGLSCIWPRLDADPFPKTMNGP